MHKLNNLSIHSDSIRLSDNWETVSKWMHSKTEVSDELTITRVTEIMVERNIGSVLVLFRDKEVGMLTERDILSKVIVKGRDPNTTTTGDIATKPLISINEKDTIWMAAELMGKHHIRRIPVANDEGEILGVLTTRSISDALPVISRFLESRDLQTKLQKMKHRE